MPGLGGRIVSLDVGGRQWLWTNPDLPYREPVEGSPYAETGDVGGYDECFPTVAACVLPSGISHYGGLALPDHGELWTQCPPVRFDLDEDGQRATCVWHGRLMPYRFMRTVQVTAMGEVRMQYTVDNLGANPLPFIWASQPLLPLTEATRLDLPIGAVARVADAHGSAVRGMTPEFRWPNVRLATRIADLSAPPEVARRYACKVFIEMPLERVLLGVTEGSVRLDVWIDGREIPLIGLWLNRGEWSPPGRTRAPQNLSFAPCIGGPDSLTAAMNAWRTAQWLPAGGRRTWSVTWSGRQLDAETG